MKKSTRAERPCRGSKASRIPDASSQPRRPEGHFSASRDVDGQRARSAARKRPNDRNPHAAAAKLRQAATVFTSTHEGVVITDPDGAIVAVNPAFCTITGYTEAEVLGRNMRLLQSGRHGPEFYREMWNALLAGGCWRGELWNRRKNGEIYPELATISAVRGDNDKLVNYIGVFSDIARIKEAEAERRVMEAQLRQAQKMEAIGNLTGGLAHDFNNLLGIVIGNLDLLDELPTTDPQSKELAREALDAALRGADLAQRLLAFARRQPLQPALVDLNELAGRMSKLLARTVGENIEIQLDLGTDVWPVVVDPAQMEASLVNIVNNARDALPNGGLVTIATGNRHLDGEYASQHPGLAPGDYALIEVSDTGVGMPQAVVERIFEPFFTTKDQGKGTGLGLSMVFGFMKQSGGHVSVYSEPGNGTTMRLFLPRASSGMIATEAQRLPEVGPGGRETILVVEDNTGLRRVVVRQLKELGYRLLEAPDGPAALGILGREPVDLLFSDIVMPGGMSGYDLARTALARWPAMKAVLTSGLPEKMVACNGEPPVHLRLLNKPYRKADLARTLREALDA